MGHKVNKTVTLLYESLAKTVTNYLALQDYLVADLKHLKGKQKDLIAKGVATLQTKDDTTLFHVRDGDCSLKRHRSFLEGSATGSSKRHVAYGGK